MSRVIIKKQQTREEDVIKISFFLSIEDLVKLAKRQINFFLLLFLYPKKEKEVSIKKCEMEIRWQYTWRREEKKKSILLPGWDVINP